MCVVSAWLSVWSLMRPHAEKQLVFFMNDEEKLHKHEPPHKEARPSAGPALCQLVPVPPSPCSLVRPHVSAGFSSGTNSGGSGAGFYALGDGPRHLRSTLPGLMWGGG